MVRPLHLDEAQRALHVKVPAQEGHNSESGEKSELALEFSRLLEQVQGPVAAAHDEVMALGLALAQAIPIMHQTRHEVQAVEVGVHDTEERGTVEGDAPEVTVETRERTVTETQSSRAQGSVARSSDVESEESSSAQSQTEVDAEHGASDAEDFSEEDVAMALDILSLDDSEDSNTPEISVLQEKGDDGEPIVTTTLFTASPRSQTTASQEIAEDDQTFLTSADVLAVEGEVREVKQGQERAESEASEAQTDSSELPTTAPEQRSALQQRERLVESRTRMVQGGFNEGPAEQPRVVNPGKNGQIGKSALDAGASSESVYHPETLSVKKDPALQLTILRQAFEGLRLRNQDGLDQKSRPSMPQVTTALGVAPEARAAKQQLSPKAMRHLDRTTTQRMLERVEATLKEAARSRDGKTISLRLDPAQLGRVKVDVSLREGALHARITPENRQVLASLREHAHELQGALRKLGLNVDSVTVAVTSDGGQEMSDFGKELNHGKSFQQDRNNMPDEAQQVPEKTIGSELAEGSTVGSPQKDVTVEDHWVA